MKNLKKYGRTYLFKLDVDGEETYTAIVRNMQHAVVGGELLMSVSSMSRWMRR